MAHATLSSPLCLVQGVPAHPAPASARSVPATWLHPNHEALAAAGSVLWPPARDPLRRRLGGCVLAGDWPNRQRHQSDHRLWRLRSVKDAGAKTLEHGGLEKAHWSRPLIHAVFLFASSLRGWWRRRLLPLVASPRSGRPGLVQLWRRIHRFMALLLIMALCWRFRPLQAWGSGMAAGPVAEVSGTTFAVRVLHYRSIFGSLLMDAFVVVLFFFIFACCAGMETAITTLWPYKVRELALREEGVNGMWTALRRDLQRFLQTILIGATISGVLSTAVVTEISGQLFGPRGLGWAAVSVTLGQLIFAEMIPKSIAVSKPLPFAKAFLPTFHRVSKLLYPISKVINVVVSFLLSLLGVTVDTSKHALVSEEELDMIFRDAELSGLMEEAEGKMIRSVRNLDVRKVKDVMTPLVDMIGIDGEESLAELFKLWSETQFTRIPVYTDRFDSIMGVISMRALLKHVGTALEADGDETKPAGSRQVKEICDKPFFVPETMSLLNSLRFLKERSLAICVDEYGGTTGLVTLEDVLGEIVGEIYNSDEQEKHRREKRRWKSQSQIKSLGGGRWTMAASVTTEDVQEVLHLQLPAGDYNSIGGFLCHIIDRLPRIGEKVHVTTDRGSVSFAIDDVDDRRILSVTACQQPPPPDSAAAAAEEEQGDAASSQPGIEADKVYEAEVLDIRAELIDEVSPLLVPAQHDTPEGAEPRGSAQVSAAAEG